MAVIADLARLYSALKERKSTLNAEISEINVQLDGVELDLHDALILAELDKVAIDGVTYKPVVKQYASIPGDKQEAAFAALRAEGHGGLIKETIHPGTLNAWIREIFDSTMGALPEWIPENINVFSKKEISARKG